MPFQSSGPAGRQSEHRLHTYYIQYNKHGGHVVLKRTFRPRLRSPRGTLDPRLAHYSVSGGQLVFRYLQILLGMHVMFCTVIGS